MANKVVYSLINKVRSETTLRQILRNTLSNYIKLKVTRTTSIDL